MNNGTPHSSYRKTQMIVPQSASTAITGTGVDCGGWNWLDVVLDVGAMSANATIDLTLEECDTLGGTYAAISGAVFSQKLAASGGSKMYSGDIDLSKRKRFIRAVCTNATAASVVAVVGILSKPDRTERVQAAQLGSSPAATPLEALAVSGGAEFSV